MSHAISPIPPEVLDAVRRDVPFSLTCYHCDRGQHIGSLAQAVAEGWVDFQYDPDGPTYNFVGNCSECWKDDRR